MAEISAKLVKQLRDMTGVGMMDCKKALIETDGDVESAVEFLRKTGIAKAAKKVGRESKDGRIEAITSDDGKKGAMVELASETDFVAKNEDFVEFAQKLAKLVLDNEIPTIEHLLESPFGEGKVSDVVTELVAKIGENIVPKKSSFFAIDNHGLVHYYIHPGNKVGVMIELQVESSEASTDNKITDLANELAMQIAFSKPVALSKDNVPEDELESEKRIYREQAIQEGKPEKAIEKIVEGRIQKYLKDFCLLSQEYIRDSKMTVEQLIDNVSKELGSELKLTRFARFEIGAS